MVGLSRVIYQSSIWALWLFSWALRLFSWALRLFSWALRLFSWAQKNMTSNFPDILTIFNDFRLRRHWLITQLKKKIIKEYAEFE